MKFDFANYKHPDQFGKWLGYQVDSYDIQTSQVQTSLKIREDHLSPAGRVHGGVISAFFDFSCGAAVFVTMGPKDFCSTVELKVNYFKPVNLSDQLKASTQVIFRGNRLAVCHGKLFRNEDPQPIAMVTATFNIVSEKDRKA